jgi:hypothetical protein
VRRLRRFRNFREMRTTGGRVVSSMLVYTKRKHNK